MSVPHLDRRYVDGKVALLFGPYAGWSTKFLKHGSYTDLFKSVEIANLIPMLDVAKDNLSLEKYLLGQVLETSSQRFAALLECIIRKHAKKIGGWKRLASACRS